MHVKHLCIFFLFLYLFQNQNTLLHLTFISKLVLFCVCFQGVETRQNICSNLSDHSQLLTLEQKLYVVKKEVADTQKEQKQLQLKYKKILDNYKVTTHTQLCTISTQYMLTGTFLSFHL